MNNNKCNKIEQILAEGRRCQAKIGNVGPTLPICA